MKKLILSIAALTIVSFAAQSSSWAVSILLPAIGKARETKSVNDPNVRSGEILFYYNGDREDVALKLDARPVEEGGNIVLHDLNNNGIFEPGDGWSCAAAGGGVATGGVSGTLVGGAIAQ